MEKNLTKKVEREPLSHELLSRVVGGVDLISSVLCPRCFRAFSTLTSKDHAMFEAHVKSCRGK